MQSETLQPCDMVEKFKAEMDALVRMAELSPYHDAGSRNTASAMRDAAIRSFEAIVTLAWNTRATVEISDAMVERGMEAIGRTCTWDGDTFAHDHTREELTEAAKSCLTAALGPTT